MTKRSKLPETKDRNRNADDERASWNDELRARVLAIRRGEVKGIAAEDVFARLRAESAKRRRP